MRIDRMSLLQVLESVQPGLTPRDVLEQSSCFVFRDGDVVTFNDEIACRRASPLNISGAVQAGPLLSLLRRMPEDHIEIDVTPGELILRGKRRRAGIRMSEDIALPFDRVEAAIEWQKIHEDFSDAIHVAQQCVGKDESNYTTTCIHIHPKWIEACDNHQAVRFRLKTRVKESILVRGASAKHIVSTDMTEFAETESWIHFRNPTGLIFACRRDVQAYESLETILAVEGEPLVLPKGLAEAAEKAEIFSAENADENEVIVDLQPGKLKVTGTGVSGWYSESKKIKYRGKSLRFSIGPGLLSELVKRYSDCVVCENRLKVDSGKFVYVVALGTDKAAESTATSEEQ